MKKYEGLIIFPQMTDEQVLEEKLGKIRNEITRLGGVVAATTRMGRNAFARPLKKKESGVYALVAFSLDPLQIASLRERLKLNEDVVRIMIVNAPKPAKPASETAAPAAPVA